MYDIEQQFLPLLPKTLTEFSWTHDWAKSAGLATTSSSSSDSSSDSDAESKQSPWISTRTFDSLCRLYTIGLLWREYDPYLDRSSDSATDSSTSLNIYGLDVFDEQLKQYDSDLPSLDSQVALGFPGCRLELDAEIEVDRYSGFFEFGGLDHP